MNTKRLLTLLVFIGFAMSTYGMGRIPTRPIKLQIDQGTPLPVPRTFHSMTQLQNGKILIVGGSSSSDAHMANVDIFDPVKKTYTPTSPLHTARHGHTATLLRDGRVLVIGGYSLPQQWLVDAEIYDPATGQWTQTYPIHSHGTVHTATLMNDGRVLVVGGCIGDTVCTNEVEIFDPATDSWIQGPVLASDRSSHTAQLLRDGRVLIAGGTGESGEIPADGPAVVYDPIQNEWSSTGPMIAPRFQAQSVLLPDGRVFVAGGILAENMPALETTNASEFYDPRTNTWKAGGSLLHERYGFVMAFFRKGFIVAVGGSRVWDCCWTDSSFVHEVEVYDLGSNTWRTVSTLPEVGVYGSGIFLPNTQFWVTGGQAGPDSLSSSWLISTKPMTRSQFP